jgi:hypothetical protein
MMRKIPIAIAVVLMVLVAVVQGYWTDRWGRHDAADVLQGVANLANVPKNFGDWEGTDVASDPQQIKVAKVSGVMQRSYKNIRTGAMVNIYLAVGRARNLSIHTPDKCYAAAGFRQTEDLNSLDVKSEATASNFYVGQFRKDDPEGASLLRILWSWNDGHGWQAPETPKIAFANSSALYKLYAIRAISREDENIAKDPLVEFLQVFLPEVDRALQVPAKEGGNAIAAVPSAA